MPLYLEREPDYMPCSLLTLNSISLFYYFIVMDSGFSWLIEKKTGANQIRYILRHGIAFRPIKIPVHKIASFSLENDRS